MLTQCPSCHTTFRVTREILRVADGQVRCGRCQTQFDALEQLLDEPDPEEAEPRFTEPDQAAREDITLEGRHIEISGRYRVSETRAGESAMREETREEWVEIENVDEALEAPPAEDGERPESFDSYSSEPETQDVEDLGYAEESEPLYDAQDRETEPEPGPEEEEDTSVDEAAAASYASRHRARPTEPEPEDDFDLTTPAPRARTPWIWKALVAPLALLLIVQIVHHYRATLARHPQIGPLLIRAYESVGLTLRPDWDLHAYEILQWHVGSDPQAPGTLKVRASVKNNAPFPQPYPLLKLVLEDRWGEQVRAREFEPRDYLDPTRAPDRLLAPAQQANATISIVDPGPDAEGFRFDVCLRGKNGPVCSQDVPIR
ncbi:MAG TPA: DUF3426 domain-containing protein [Steroidobacter sp.]|jgi:predicted Zn finger-like uncharacterized protein